MGGRREGERRRAGQGKLAGEHGLRRRGQAGIASVELRCDGGVGC